MLEIISLIIITRYIGRLAELKKLDVRKWKVISILLFFVLELTGCIVSLLFVAPDNIVTIALIGFAFGITSYPLIKNHLSKLPDPEQSGLDQ